MELINCIERLPGAVALLDNNLKVMVASPKWNDRYAGEDGSKGELISDLVPEISDRQISRLESCLKEEKEVSFEIKERGDLAKQWCCKSWKKDKKEIKGIIVHSANCSVLEEKLESHFRKEFLLESVLNSINTGVIACDKSAQLLLFNKAARNMHGLAERKMKPENLARYYSLYDKDGKTLLKTDEIPLLNMLHEGVIEKNEIVIKSVDGDPVIVSVTGSRLYNKQGEIDGAVVALHDVTEAREAQEKLEISEETFRRNFEDAAIGMAITGLQGECIRANESLCEIMGYSQEEITQLKFQEVTHPDDLGKDIELIGKLIQGEKDSYQLEKRAIHKSGRIIYLNIAVSVVRDNSDHPLYFISQISDVTRQKKAEEKLSYMLSITQDQNERLKNFAHIVSHNLRSHSGNIEMLLDLYLEDYPEQKRNELMEMLVAASKRLSETINHLNEVSLINTTTEKKLTALNLRHAVNNTMDSISALIQKYDVLIENEIPGDYEVLCIPSYLESIILNFATNAINYRSVKRQPRVRFQAEKNNGYINLIIEDNGVGINLNKNSDKIFGMYKTFHKGKSSRGIGLFITKNQIEAVGGKVKAESKVGKGSRFTISFKYEKN
ncbi:PAS domain S-box protein [Gramella jeungdoensis]|uniref:histidine kinase n=1 Tax=Gramella jeungdoensis TaxID=708091 RepID=A0ABT0Z2C2_9FLAO|nr:PAS domain S-box protein [Gramella jeungdoensis]MCM8569530.1 PAS domain S-box protein [Gramella jeungdoensis]